MDDYRERQEQRERLSEADRTLQKILRGKLRANRLVLTDEGRIVRAEEEPQTGGEDES